MAIPATTTSQAIDALLKWKKTQSDSQNPQLLPQDDFIYLILTLKKIPQKGGGGGGGGARINPNKIPLPHPLIAPNSFPEICLIIDDRPNSNLTSKTAKQKIKDESICVTKVIKLSKLKTDYKPFEAKRKLCDSYEMFFADKRVIPLLPKLLGKQFFRKKKLPLGVDLSHKNWKEQVERGCSSGLLFFRTGTCCVIRVAKVSMDRDQIVENVSAAIDGAVEFVPKKLSGVRSFHLKFSDSVALPLYQCLPDIKLRIEGVKDRIIEDVVKQGTEVFVSDEEVENCDELVEEKPTKKSDDGGVSGKKKRKGGVVGAENKKKPKKVVEGNVDDDEEKGGEGEEIEKNETESVVVGKKGKKRKENVGEEKDVKMKSGDKKAKKKGGHDDDEEEEGGEGEEIEKNEADRVVVGKKGVKEKKRKGNVVEEKEVKTKSSDKKAKKKKGEKQIGESAGKKEKRKGRSVGRV